MKMYKREGRNQVNNIDKPKLIMLVGLPGSGKSTYISEHYSDINVHSSDAIREELSGDINNQDINKQVFETLHRRVKNDLANGISCCYDATNISWKRRKAFLTELNKINCNKCCYLIATPFEICLQRNSNRDRVVPYQVIERMYKSFDIPFYNEGWDNITVVTEYPDFYGDWENFVDKHSSFVQDSKWHSLTLGNHCLKTLQYVQSKGADLNPLVRSETIIAAALHDCGKPFCKAFKDSKGNESKFAHYYNHENVGSYNSLFFKKESDIDNLVVAALIRYHMIPHFFKDWNQKTIDKYEKEFVENTILSNMEFYSALKILHEGDKSAH